MELPVSGLLPTPSPDASLSDLRANRWFVAWFRALATFVQFKVPL